MNKKWWLKAFLAGTVIFWGVPFVCFVVIRELWEDISHWVDRL